MEPSIKVLTQTLMLKTFVATSANAILDRTWTALIAILTQKFLHLNAHLG